MNARLLANLQAETSDYAEAQIEINATQFCDPAVLEEERKALFLNTPQPAAFSGELPQPGSYLAIELVGVPVLLTRDDKGEIHAHINACVHRGAPVAQSQGNRRTLVCPFHGWAYNLDGSLRGIPEADCFSTPKEDAGLQRLPVSERGGIIVVGPNPAIAQGAVDGALTEISEELGSFEFQHYRQLVRRDITVNANWKLINDLSLESYHFSNLHRDSVAQFLAANAIFDHWDKSSRWAFPLKSIIDLASKAQGEWPDSLQGSCTYTLYPGVMVVVNALGAQMIRAEPGATPGTSRVTYTGMCIADCDEEAARSACEFGAEVFTTEDLPMAEACQRGLEATTKALPLGRNEPLLQFWHGLWQRAIE